MMPVSQHKAGLVVPALMGGWHLLWSLLAPVVELNHQFPRPHISDNDTGAELVSLGRPSRGHRISDIIELVMHYAINSDLERAFDELHGALDARALLRL